MGSMIELTAADGHKFGAYKAEPAGKPRGAVVVVMEIFGVNSHIRSVADGYAADGYLAIAPAMFDRVQRNYECGYTPPEIEVSRGLMQKASLDDAIKDVTAAIKAVESAGKVGSSPAQGGKTPPVVGPVAASGIGIGTARTIEIGRRIQHDQRLAGNLARE